MSYQDTYTLIKYARAYIDQSYTLPINLDLIAQQAGFSKYHFIRVFQDTYAITPYQYVMEKRLEYAKYLLRSSDLSVTEVCFEVGFQSLGSFSSLFQRSVGASPRVYRQRLVAGVSLRRRMIPGCFVRMFGLQQPPL